MAERTRTGADLPEQHLRPAEPSALAPDSATVRAVSDWRILAVAPAALVLQTSHPVIGAGVAQHSIYTVDPILRFQRSFWQTLGLAFYGSDYGRDVRALHKPIGGVDHQGRRYHAWHGDGYFFVLATAMWAIETVAERFDKIPLSPAQRHDVYDGIKQMARLAGAPEPSIPATLVDYDRYFADTMAKLEDHPAAQQLRGTVADIPVPAALPGALVPLWRPMARRVLGPVAVLLTVGLTPAQHRAVLGWEWSERDERKLAGLIGVAQVVHRVLPTPLRQITRTMALRRRAEFHRQISDAAAVAASTSTV